MGTDTSFPERRLAPRTVLSLPGTIIAHDGVRPVPCVVIDMSQKGASIRAHDVALPDEFILSLNANSSVLRNCKVIWRESFMVGVQFAERKKASAGIAPT
jgi:hypothetical protein